MNKEKKEREMFICPFPAYFDRNPPLKVINRTTLMSSMEWKTTSWNNEKDLNWNDSNNLKSGNMVCVFFKKKNSHKLNIS